MLEDGVDVALVRRHAGDRPPGEEDLALGRLLEAGDHPEGRGLAAARRAEQARERCGWDREPHVIDRDDRPEALRDVDHLDVRVAGARRARRRTTRPPDATGRPDGWRRSWIGQARGNGHGPLAAQRDGCGNRSTSVAMLQGARMVSGALRQRQRRQRTTFESDSARARASRTNTEAILQPRGCLAGTYGGLRDHGCHGAPARAADPVASPGPSGHPPRARRAGRRDGELPLPGRARGDQPVDRVGPADRPGPRPRDRRAVRRRAAARPRRPAGRSATDPLQRPQRGRRVPDCGPRRTPAR